ncbi:hypothetical protein DL770_003381 [Monosporascus sp. CRB-9-2]|nr:hypothetical protein DL770_003381 [Monosporascus sp. CRB-9-2]
MSNSTYFTNLNFSHTHLVSHLLRRGLHLTADNASTKLVMDPSDSSRPLICLLSGSPGVGKTLTAEAVAENLRVPLHSLTSDDLGLDPWEVETGLSRILDLVARWNVVSIFLRTLKPYEGILFMTTNRVDNMDAAFQSRIHVSLEYPNLTSHGRRQIWHNFLDDASSLRSEVTAEDVDQLSELDLNGRQIKNVLRTAQLLASRKKTALKRESIDTVLAIEKRQPGMQK